MSRSRVRGIVSLLSLSSLALVLTVALRDAEAQTRPAAPNAARAARGKFLVASGGCNDCHTPWKMGANGIPEPDMTKMLMGHPENMKMPPPPAPVGPWIWFGAATNTAYAGPWGVTYSMNLTPDQNTGMGVWTEEMFVKSMRTGKHMGTSRMIQPPMPWQAYSHLPDEDLKAMFAYLRSIPAIKNRVPDYQEPRAAGKPVPPKAPARKS